MVAAIAWAHATGHGRAAFAKYQSSFYWYHFVPGLDPLIVEKIGVTRCADDPGAVSPAHCGANHLLFLTFTREHDGLGLAWMEQFHSQEPAWSRDREALGRFLWWDPDQKPIDPATLPTTRLFPTSGHVTMRSDWSSNATFATFRCRRFGEIDGTWGRNNADNLSFTIRKCTIGLLGWRVPLPRGDRAKRAATIGKTSNRKETRGIHPSRRGHPGARERDVSRHDVPLEIRHAPDAVHRPPERRYLHRRGRNGSVRSTASYHPEPVGLVLGRDESDAARPQDPG